MLAAMTTGHDGSLSTVHAGSPAEALRRVEMLALMADVDLPLPAIREQLADALDLIVHQARLPDGRRQVTAVSEVVRIAAGPATRDIYTFTTTRPRWRTALSEARVAVGGRMTGPLLAAAAAMLGVFGAWEALAIVEELRPAQAIGRALAPPTTGRQDRACPDGAGAAALGARRGSARCWPRRWLLAGPVAGIVLVLRAPRPSIRCSPRGGAAGDGRWPTGCQASRGRSLMR